MFLPEVSTSGFQIDVRNWQSPVGTDDIFFEKQHHDCQYRPCLRHSWKYHQSLITAHKLAG
jgi:hypothetical protein